MNDKCSFKITGYCCGLATRVIQVPMDYRSEDNLNWPTYPRTMCEEHARTCVNGGPYEYVDVPAIEDSEAEMW